MSLTSRILLAEDEVHIARLVIFKLSKAGFQLTHAVNGVEAVEQFEAGLKGNPWDLVLLDVMMPGLSGWEVLSRIRQSSRPQTPVILLTAKGSARDQEDAMRLGASHFLHKPFDPEELVRVVRQSLSAAAPGKSQGMQEEMERLKREFVDSFAERANAIESSLHAQVLDREGIKLHAHRLSGTAATYGFVHLGRLAEQIEGSLEAQSTSVQSAIELMIRALRSGQGADETICASEAQTSGAKT